jgi:predicted PurR-regulated permease PerM
MAAGIVLITIFIIVCVTLLFIIPLVSFDQTFLSKRKVWLLISQYMDIKAQISRNEAKQIRETLQQIQDSLTKVESQIADIVIELHDRRG